jgi:transposase
MVYSRSCGNKADCSGDLGKAPPEVQAYILVLEKALRQALERIVQLEPRANELEARLNRHSGNSSQPPSQDPPQAPKNHREKSERRPGGQPGPQGNHRLIVPPEKVAKIVEHRAEACPHCRSLLPADAARPVPPLERHQGWELPEIRPVVTEHRLIPGWCPYCRVWVKPELPAEVGRSALGPRLQAWVAILTLSLR